MTGDVPLDALKEAYKVWNDSRGHSADTWLALIGDEFHLHDVDPDGPGLAFARERKSKEEMAEFFTSLNDAWDMVHWTPGTYVVQGDLVAMFGRCGWTNKATGKAIDVPISHLWRFKDGKIVELTEVFDSAPLVAASTP